MIVILSLFGMLLSFMTIKVKKQVWKQDKVLPMVLFFMTAAIFMYDCYFLVQAVVYNKIGWVTTHSYLWTFMMTYYSA